MDSPRPPAPPPAPRAAGAILALSIMGGAVIGLATGQPTIGTLAGLAFGVIVSVLVWLADRRRG